VLHHQTPSPHAASRFPTERPVRCRLSSSGRDRGRFDGRAVINEFTDLKWITVEPSNQPYPF
jgi:hypothetical protein